MLCYNVAPICGSLPFGRLHPYIGSIAQERGKRKREAQETINSPGRIAVPEHSPVHERPLRRMRTGSAGRPLKDLLRCGGRRPLRRVRTGSAGRRGRRPLRACADGKRGASGTPPPTGVCGGEARGVGDAAPYGVCGLAHMAVHDRRYGAYHLTPDAHHLSTNT